MSSMPTLKPRLVCLHKRDGVNSFGFNVTATRSEPYRYIGIVVDNTLAKQAGLRSGDRVHEVNRQCVDGLPLPEVQSLIAQGKTDVELLVADPMTDQLYRDNNEEIKNGLPETIVIHEPPLPGQDFEQYDDQQIETEVVDPDDFMQNDNNNDDDEGEMNILPVPPPIDDTPAASSPFKARLCTIKKWPDYKGFGFVLHGDKEEPGQNIGKVEPGSPCEAAGVRAGDRLIEVNGTNVENMFQQDVVRLIAGGPVPDQTQMLVVDPDALRFFRGHGITCHSSMVDIERIETPPRALVSANFPSSNAKVRLCHVKKYHDFPGYGFVLHGERGTPGTYLTNIDPGSPAELAGIKDGDKIIEINGVNVESEEQPQAIHRIQMGVDGDTSQTRLLVVDPESERYFRRQNIPISGSMSDIVYMTNPDRQAPIVLSDPTPDAPAVKNTRRARLCHVKKWHDFDGYGFYLHSNDDSNGVCIGKVDPGSPAEAAGLQRMDRIIEVNGDNCESCSQDDVVEKVVAVPEETRLLVVDPQTYSYFLNNGILVNGNMTDIDITETPSR